LFESTDTWNIDNVSTLFTKALQTGKGPICEYQIGRYEYYCCVGRFGLINPALETIRHHVMRDSDFLLDQLEGHSHKIVELCIDRGC